jgi:6-phosphogluconolactonase
MTILRRKVFFVALSPLAAAASVEPLLYAGTYTRNGSQGIYAFRFHSQTGRLTPLGLAAEASNPSFLAIHRNRRWLYAANENKDGTISAYAIDPASAKLTLLNQVSAQGAAPCHIALSGNGRLLGAANYSSGNAGLFPIGKDGKLGEGAMVQHQGSGPNPGRQREPHAHSLNFSRDGKFAMVADLGVDQLVVYRVAGGKLTDPKPVKLAPGAGPRHFAFHPSQKFAYVNNELASTLTAFAYRAGGFKEIATLSTLPPDFKGENFTAETVVHPSGRFVYVSNRGHHSIARFSIDPKTGKSEFLGTTPTGGQWPRNFTIDPSGRYLLAANERSNSIHVFTIGSQDGALTPAGSQVEIPSPVCLRFLTL